VTTLEVRDLHVAYGDSHVVQGVSLELRQGQVAVLLGRNGVGKTTLIRAIAGLTPPRAGHVLLGGDDITGASAEAIARRGVGLVPQGRRLFPSLTVGEHLAVGARGTGGWTPARVLQLFPRLRERLRQRGSTLSGGEQTMLAAGRALVSNPKVLLMDEPSEGLAPLLVRELGRIVGDLKRDGASILLVEQNLAFALRVADHVYVMSKGRVVVDCAPDELRRSDDLKARWLGV
jgi:branched-chain amino acid transport system ATP-binding protein